jgi:hypothetical protein
MAWDNPLLHPARQSRSHPNGAVGFATLEVNVSPGDDLRSWLGEGLPSNVVVRNRADVGPGKLWVSTTSGRLEVD